MFEQELRQMYWRVSLLKGAHWVFFALMCILVLVASAERHEYNSTLEALEPFAPYGALFALALLVRCLAFTAPFLRLRIDQLLFTTGLSWDEKMDIWRKSRGNWPTD